jgi:hypothetical protein
MPRAGMFRSAVFGSAADRSVRRSRPVRATGLGPAWSRMGLAGRPECVKAGMHEGRMEGREAGRKAGRQAGGEVGSPDRKTGGG